MTATLSELFRVDCADCLDWLRSMPEQSLDLVFGSPPYESQRTYGIGFNLRGQAWVDWMVEVFRAATRACRGLVAMVVEGPTDGFRWSASPALLMADLHRAGFRLRKPPAFHRFGVCGSGGPDWFRNDYEFVVCTAPKGRLPWSDNTACGHPPKWAPGGECSNRFSDGTRVNQWGKTGGKSGLARKKDGSREKNGVKPSHRFTTKAHTKRVRDAKSKGGDVMVDQTYKPPAIANPGNVIRCKVGGGQMGDPLAHDNEAPFPESLAERFVRSFCPEGGIVADPFSGSGTTGAVALRWGRRFLGCDVRESMVELSRRRIGQHVGLFSEAGNHV